LRLALRIGEANDSCMAKTCCTHAIILSHPGAESFNAAVARTYCEVVEGAGHKAVLRDLYRSGFNPVMKNEERPGKGDFTPAPDVAEEIALIRDADVFVLVYPIWFGGPPAMLKGYVERVLGAGVHYRAIRDRRKHNFLNGKHLLSITTSGTSIQWLDEQGAWLSLRDVFDRYLARAFTMASDEHLHLSNITEGMSARHVDEELEHVAQMAREVCSSLEAHHGKKPPMFLTSSGSRRA
jgi:NAD(P)H dehydrogenase (quinone)